MSYGRLTCCGFLQRSLSLLMCRDGWTLMVCPDYDIESAGSVPVGGKCLCSCVFVVLSWWFFCMALEGLFLLYSIIAFINGEWGSCHWLALSFLGAIFAWFCFLSAESSFVPSIGRLIWHEIGGNVGLGIAFVSSRPTNHIKMMENSRPDRCFFISEADNFDKSI